MDSETGVFLFIGGIADGTRIEVGKHRQFVRIPIQVQIAFDSVVDWDAMCKIEDYQKYRIKVNGKVLEIFVVCGMTVEQAIANLSV